MLEKITMIIFLIIQILFLLICCSTYLFIKGTDELKTDEEKRFEENEQIKFLKEVEEKKSENK